MKSDQNQLEFYDYESNWVSVPHPTTGSSSSSSVTLLLMMIFLLFFVSDSNSTLLRGKSYGTQRPELEIQEQPFLQQQAGRHNWIFGRDKSEAGDSPTPRTKGCHKHRQVRGPHIHILQTCPTLNWQTVRSLKKKHIISLNWRILFCYKKTQTCDSSPRCHPGGHFSLGVDLLYNFQYLEKIS